MKNRALRASSSAQRASSAFELRDETMPIGETRQLIVIREVQQPALAFLQSAASYPRAP